MAKLEHLEHEHNAMKQFILKTLCESEQLYGERINVCNEKCPHLTTGDYCQTCKNALHSIIITGKARLPRKQRD